MAKDPVCGMDVIEEKAAAKSEYQSKTYYFCSLNCKTKFDKDPEAYLSSKAREEMVPVEGAAYICPMDPEVRENKPGACPKCGMALKEAAMATVATRIARPLQFGMGGSVLLLAIYFGVVSLISGMDFALGQFAKFWYFIVTLAIGFGIQVGLYAYLKNIVGQHGASGKVVAVSGTTSTAAMVSCCVHYLANILPILGVTGFLSVVAEYQVELFWLALVFNAVGILYILSKVVNASRAHKK